MIKRIKFAAGAALLVAGLAACTATSKSDSSTSSVAAAKNGVSIGVVVHGAVGDAFWSDVKDGVEAAAKETGASVDYQTSADPDEQGRFIAAEVSKKVKALVVSIPSVDALQG